MFSGRRGGELKAADRRRTSKENKRPCPQGLISREECYIFCSKLANSTADFTSILSNTRRPVHLHRAHADVELVGN